MSRPPLPPTAPFRRVRASAEVPPGALRVAPGRLPPLGTEADVVAVDLRAGVDPDLLARAHGHTRRELVVVLADRDPPLGALALWPHGPDEVGLAFAERLRRWLAAAPARAGEGPRSTAEQDRLVAAPLPHRLAILGARGRGKSAALGRLLARHGGVVTAADRAQVTEVLAFAPGAPFVPVEDVAPGPPLVVVDEAASLPVHVLKTLCERLPDTPMVFATTTEGYEGSGRGFVHRFLPWLGGRVETLRAPIRWPEGDPLEGWLRGLLLLDAEVGPAPSGRAPGEPEHLPRARLARDEALLRSVFGLLQDAHYRTTPADLARLLDAPNLEVHAILDGPTALAVALVAREGGLPADVVDRMAAGERIRGHALPDTLVAHAGRRDAATLRWARSVRIATHPELRREGLAARLVAHVHAASGAPDAFGTVFGATPELVRFRRALGYVPIRLGATRGARSGEPSVVMARPVTPAAEALVADLRAALARDLPTQVALLGLDSGFPLDPALVAELARDLPAPAPDEGVARYVSGPATYEACAVAIERFVAARPGLVAASPDRELLVGRAVERLPWRALGPLRGGVPQAMRAMRRAVAALAAVEPPG